MKKIYAIAFINLFLYACSTSGVGYMQQKQLLKTLETEQAPLIIDVRSSAEYNAGHVPGAIHIPFWTTFGSDKMVAYPKQQEIVVYCAHGPRAGVAKLALKLSGFENISYLAGHMSGWTNAGLIVEKGR